MFKVKWALERELSERRRGQYGCRAESRLKVTWYIALPWLSESISGPLCFHAARLTMKAFNLK
jgi:hypothetical protein